MEMEEDNRRSVWNNNKDLLHLPPSVALLKGNWFSFYRMRLEQISYLPPSVALLKGNWFTFYRMRLEQISYYPVQIYLAYYHFSLWWWVFLVPQSCAKFSLITMNMLQHDGCLVLRELGQTPDPYIAEGSQTVQEVDFAQMATEAEEIQRKVRVTFGKRKGPPPSHSLQICILSISTLVVIFSPSHSDPFYHLSWCTSAIF